MTAAHHRMTTLPEAIGTVLRSAAAEVVTGQRWAFEQRPDGSHWVQRR